MVCILYFVYKVVGSSLSNTTKCDKFTFIPWSTFFTTSSESLFLYMKEMSSYIYDMTIILAYLDSFQPCISTKIVCMHDYGQCIHIHCIFMCRVSRTLCRSKHSMPKHSSEVLFWIIPWSLATKSMVGQCPWLKCEYMLGLYDVSCKKVKIWRQYNHQIYTFNGLRVLVTILLRYQ